MTALYPPLPLAQALPCLRMRTRLTVIFLTFSVACARGRGQYFGSPAFRNRHFVIWGGRVAGGGDPPPLYSSLGSTMRYLSGLFCDYFRWCAQCKLAPAPFRKRVSMRLCMCCVRGCVCVSTRVCVVEFECRCVWHCISVQLRSSVSMHLPCLATLSAHQLCTFNGAIATCCPIAGSCKKNSQNSERFINVMQALRCQSLFAAFACILRVQPAQGGGLGRCGPPNPYAMANQTIPNQTSLTPSPPPPAPPPNELLCDCAPLQRFLKAGLGTHLSP